MSTRTPEGAPHGFADEAQRYRLDSRIATGGMGEVWRATDTTLGRTVAVKLLKAEYADSPEFRSRFATEARHAASLHHPGVAAVYDFGELARPDGSGSTRPYLVMELVDGQPLSALLRPGQPLDPAATRDLLAQAADAIGAAHAAGIVHRDVKPANLLVTPSRKVKITDFGIARATEGAGLTETGQVMGTPQYLSPEQAEGRPVTPASDVYSLGVVAYECLAGRRPFVAASAVATALAHVREPVPDLPDDVPADLAAVVQRALAKTPGDRYPDATAFAAALRDPAGGATRVVPAAGAREPQRTRLLTGVAPAAAGVAGVAAGAGAAAPGLPCGQGGPGGPVGTDPHRRRRVPWALLAVAAVLAALVVIALLARHTGGDTTAPQPRTASSRSPSAPASSAAPTSSAPSSSSAPGSPSTSAAPAETVTINENDYLGRDVKDVEKELKDLGLAVDRHEVDNPGTQQEGAVSGVSPDGTLRKGTTVTLSYYGPVPVPTSAPTSAPTDAPGHSGDTHGKGKGKGR